VFVKKTAGTAKVVMPVKQLRQGKTSKNQKEDYYHG